MELDELKNLWSAEDKVLDNRLKLNEEHIRKMNMKNITGETNKIIWISMLGRNLALVYCGISVWLAISVIEEIEYSFPAILGGLAMLWSFISHLSVEKLNYTDSIVQLQKAICTFRIHMVKNAKYDALVVAFWVLTVMPIHLRVVHNFSLYDHAKALVIFCLLVGIGLTLVIALSRRVYTKHAKKLKESESYLAELMEFETNNLRQ